ncbi:MAG: dynamin family protein [Bacillota bacterium]|nr:dynamin family protein [Bacillota bacterium]
MSLVQRVNRFLGEAINLASPFPELSNLCNDMKELKSRINKPLRVAVVGVIKAGKSTLMNALMGEKLVITGSVETTYTPTWFKYGKTPGITVKLNDGRTIEGTLEDIDYWTVRKSGNPELDRVLYVEVRSDNPFLKEIELIDTPGLASSYGTDSENTMKFVGLNRDESDKITMNEASLADAIIYAFSRGMGVNDEDILRAFQGPLFTNATAINAIGVLTKVDNYWSSGYDNPLDGGNKISANYKTNPKVKNVLYTIVPVIGRLAEVKNYLDDKDLYILEALSKLPPERFRKLLLSEQRFCEKIYDDIPVLTADREYIWNKLGQYGVYRAVASLQENSSTETLKEVLYQSSGVEDLMNIVKHHFGNRSFLIKLKFVTSRIKNQSYMIMNGEGRKSPALLNILECILSGCEKLESEEHAFAELKVLQNYYSGTLKLYDKDEIDDLLRLTGENGSNCEARLGVPEGTSITALAKIAQEKAQEWNIKANDGLNSKTYEEMAKVLARSCEIMDYHLSNLAGYK